MLVLETAMALGFEKHLKAYLYRQFPSACAVMSDVRVAALVKQGTRLAKQWGFDDERDICRYAVLMMTLAPRFDRSEKFSWATAILRDPGFVSPRERMDVLYAEANRHLALDRAPPRARGANALAGRE